MKRNWKNDLHFEAVTPQGQPLHKRTPSLCALVAVGALTLTILLTSCGKTEAPKLDLHKDAPIQSAATGTSTSPSASAFLSKGSEESLPSPQELGKQLGEQKKLLGQTFGSLRELLLGEEKNLSEQAGPILRGLPNQAKSYWLLLAAKQEEERGKLPQISEEQKQAIDASAKRLEVAVDQAVEGLSKLQNVRGEIYGGFFRDRAGAFLEEMQQSIFEGWKTAEWPLLDFLKK